MLDVTTHELVYGYPTPYNESLNWCILKLLDPSSDVRSSQQLLMPMLNFSGCLLFNACWSGMATDLSLVRCTPEDLSKKYKTLVCLISVNTKDNLNPVLFLVYGEKNLEVTKYVCILYNVQEQRYDPLYIVKKESPEEKETIFELNDETARKLIEDFIFNHFGCNIDLRIK
ncbi:unnamed protein product [Rotaria sp. Silwood2]|nr:unnamed protein product [Rotaria sp. Silwood2]CAF3316314.1 unnamed protein product [Rotaria sp. Silwood2]CAF4193868.1 unnamed protein product [Rotaria sp. Silwood2]CAF4224985.1 unnamed protein product [Rotaria sp. Silwood2]